MDIYYPISSLTHQRRGVFSDTAETPNSKAFKSGKPWVKAQR